MAAAGVSFAEPPRIPKWALDSQASIPNPISVALIARTFFERLLVDSEIHPKSVDGMVNFISLPRLLAHQLSITKTYAETGGLACHLISVNCMLLWKRIKKEEKHSTSLIRQYHGSKKSAISIKCDFYYAHENRFEGRLVDSEIHPKRRPIRWLKPVFGVFSLISCVEAWHTTCVWETMTHTFTRCLLSVLLFWSKKLKRVNYANAKVFSSMAQSQPILFHNVFPINCHCENLQNIKTTYLTRVFTIKNPFTSEWS